MDVFEDLAPDLAKRYRLERELGTGGMARVYLAHDLKHDRQVAVKVLRPELAAGVNVQRFLNEIRTAATLQHPHILPLHDSGEVHGVAYYVMPYVSGESLRTRLLHEKQLSLEDAVSIATDVASALDHAHRHGVIHRDIKPENILLQDGRAVVADFGIALALANTGEENRLTETGIAIGTPQYMAPEQVSADRNITSRADIYALGCVTYEMLVGEAPFAGATPQLVMARMLAEEPRRLVTQRRSVPPHVDAAVHRSLAKVPADRFADAAEFARALTTPIDVPARLEQRRWFTAPRIAIAGAVAAAIGLMSVALIDSPEATSTRYGLALPATQTPDPNFPILVSPDGFNLLFAVRASDSATPQLWIKARDQFEARPIAGTAGAGSFTFAPAGDAIAFVQNGVVKRLSLSGGLPTIVGDSAHASPWRGIAWLDDGSIVYVHEHPERLWRVTAGGVRTKLFESDSGFLTHLVPLPDSRGVLAVRCHGAVCENAQDLWVFRLSDGVTSRLAKDVARAVYVPTGHVLMLRRDGFLQAAPFDLRRLTLAGASVPVLDSIDVRGERAPFDVSPSATLVTRRGAKAGEAPQFQLVWVDRSGSESPLDSTWVFRFSTVSPGSSEGGWSLSPDGRRLAIGLRTSTGDDLWIKELPKGPLSRVTFSQRPHLRPRWAPDGRSLTFISRVNDRMSAFEVPVDGSGQERMILEHDRNVMESAISADGRWIVGRVGFGGSTFNRDIVAKRRDGSDTLRNLVATSFVETALALSPDGKWIAYQSNESGQLEIYVRSFPETEKVKRQISATGGYSPLWSRDGRELFYMTRAGTMTAVRANGGRFDVGTPLFPRAATMYGGANDSYTPWDISPDGQRFLMAKRIVTSRAPGGPVLVVDNWFSDLRRLLKTR